MYRAETRCVPKVIPLRLKTIREWNNNNNINTKNSNKNKNKSATVSVHSTICVSQVDSTK